MKVFRQRIHPANLFGCLTSTWADRGGRNWTLFFDGPCGLTDPPAGQAGYIHNNRLKSKPRRTTRQQRVGARRKGLADAFRTKWHDGISLFLQGVTIDEIDTMG